MMYETLVAVAGYIGSETAFEDREDIDWVDVEIVEVPYVAEDGGRTCDTTVP